MMISDTLPGMVPGQQLEDSGEGLHPVPGDSLQYRQPGTDDVPYRTQGARSL